MSEDAHSPTQHAHEAYCDPINGTALLYRHGEGLVNSDGDMFNFVGSGDCRIVDFTTASKMSSSDIANKLAYDTPASSEAYRNFLNWLFETFGESEELFRKALVDRLGLFPGAKVLVTGCGFGDDLPLISKSIGTHGILHAQDLSKAMVIMASQRCTQENVFFSISSASSLPYKARYFDAVFHFGGINLFGDLQLAIREMERVCKIGGTVLFGDEGIASHLRGTEYAEIAITNIPLWSKIPPMDLLPHNATGIELNYILGNCFYLIKFSPTNGFPHMNIDVPHKGLRGGSARTRYFGRTEGITECTKNKLLLAATNRGCSIHQLLEEIINSQLDTKK